MCILVLPAYLSVYYMQGVTAESRRGHHIPLKLELQRVVSLSIEAGKQSQVHWKRSQCSSFLTNLHNPFLPILDEMCATMNVFETQ